MSRYFQKNGSVRLLLNAMRGVARLSCAALACHVMVAAGQSLYSEQSFHPLTSDARARGVGDHLTVIVLENASATSTADTRASNDNTAGLSGTAKSMQGSVDLRTGSSFDGSGRTQRSGRLAAQLTVSVVGVTPNGDLMVQGQQLIEINGERQEISLGGRVRPADISQDNTVLSTRLGDAQIKFVGDGVVSERQRLGWLSRIFLWLGL